MRSESRGGPTRIEHQKLLPHFLSFEVFCSVFEGSFFIGQARLPQSPGITVVRCDYCYKLIFSYFMEEGHFLLYTTDR